MRDRCEVYHQEHRHASDVSGLPTTDVRDTVLIEFTAKQDQSSIADRAAALKESPVVLGFHGTSLAAAASMLQGGLVGSSNDYDWLGDGAYFFQDGPLRALEWACKVHSQPRVVRCEISLSDCMDLTDIGWMSFLADAHDRYVSRCKELGIGLPRQTSGAHRLDRAVINYAADLLAAAGSPIRSVRCAFAEGRSVFPNSALLDRAHVQIAVRDPCVILSVHDATDSIASSHEEGQR